MLVCLTRRMKKIMTRRKRIMLRMIMKTKMNEMNEMTNIYMILDDDDARRSGC